MASIANTPAFLAALYSAAASALLIADGFSTRTCLPALIAMRASAKWVLGKVAI